MSEPMLGDSPPSPMTGRVLAAAAGAAVGTVLTPALGPGGALVGAGAVPLFEKVAQWDRDAFLRANNALSEATVIAELGPEGLSEWVEGDEHRLTLLIDVVEGAFRARDQATVTALARVLASAVEDDALLDMNQLYVSALSGMRPAEAKVLEVMHSEVNARDDFNGRVAYSETPEPPPVGHSREYSIDHMRDRLPQLSAGMEYIFAVLTRAGCITEGTPRLASQDQGRFYTITAFGSACLEFLSNDQS